MPNAHDRNWLGLDRLGMVVVVIATGVAALSTRPYAGSWNDGSRLAAVESLVDYHTWAIDDSIFAGTRVKMWIDGHFYSDKSPVPTLWLVIVYRGIQVISVLDAL